MPGFANAIFFGEVMDVLQQERQKYFYRSNDDLENMEQLQFQRDYRMSKEAFFALRDIIKPLIQEQNVMERPSVSVEDKLLLTLQFYAEGIIQKTTAEMVGRSQSTACRIIKEVSGAIASLRP